MDAPQDAAPHGHAQIPPAPDTRSISPAPEDYARRPSFLQLVWPSAWLALTFALLVFVQGQGWPAFAGHEDHGTEAHGSEQHGSESHDAGQHGTEEHGTEEHGTEEHGGASD